MQNLVNRYRRPLHTVLLLAAVIGFSPFFGGSCQEILVRDVETGQLRPATPEEAAKVFTESGQIAKAALTATGHIEWFPIVDIAVRLAVLIYAIKFGQPLKPKSQASLPEGSA